jgi:hypothetical protein
MNFRYARFVNEKKVVEFNYKAIEEFEYIFSVISKHMDIKDLFSKVGSTDKKVGFKAEG